MARRRAKNRKKKPVTPITPSQRRALSGLPVPSKKKAKATLQKFEGKAVTPEQVAEIRRAQTITRPPQQLVPRATAPGVPVRPQRATLLERGQQAVQTAGRSPLATGNITPAGQFFGAFMSRLDPTGTTVALEQLGVPVSRAVAATQPGSTVSGRTLAGAEEAGLLPQRRRFVGGTQLQAPEAPLGFGERLQKALRLGVQEFEAKPGEATRLEVPTAKPLVEALPLTPLDVIPGAGALGKKAKTGFDLLTTGRAIPVPKLGPLPSIPRPRQFLPTPLPAPQALSALPVAKKPAKLPDLISGVPEPKETPVRKAIQESRSLKRKFEEFKTEARTFSEQAYDSLIDKRGPLNRFLKEGDANQLTAAINPSKRAALYAGVGGKIENRLQDFGSTLQQVKGVTDEDTLSEYLLAKRVIERHDNGITRNPVPIEDARAAVVRIEDELGDSKGQFFGVVQQINDFNDRSLKELRDAGIISKKSFDAIKSKNQSYVPFDVIDFLGDNVENLPINKRSFSVASQDVIKAAKGTERAVDDPLNAIIRRTFKTTEIVERNKVMQSLVNLRKRNKFFEDTIIEAVDGVPQPKGFGKVSVFEDGVKKDFFVPDGVANVMKSLNEKQSDILTKMASKTSRVFRAGTTTLNLPFAFISNPLRDIQTAFIAGDKFNFKDYVVGAAEAFKGVTGFRGGSKMLDEFKEAGGAFSGLLERERAIPTTRAQIRRTPAQRFMKAVTNPAQLVREVVNTIEAAGSIPELAPRLGRFSRGLKEGEDALEAAFNARNVTVDFARSGTTMKIVNQWVPFLNARAQGTLNTLRAFRDRPARAAAVASAIVGIPAASTYLWNRVKFPDLYDDIPGWIKDTNFVFITGETTDEDGNRVPRAITIPKGDVGQFLGNPIEAFLEFAWRKDPAAIDDLAVKVLSGLAPIDFEREGKLSGAQTLSSILPPVIKTGVESATNVSLFTGAPIVPRKLQGVDPAEQFTDRSTEFSKFVGQKLDVSPIKLDHFLRGTFGGVSQQILKPSQIGETFTSRLIKERGGAKEERLFQIGEEIRRTADTKKLKKDRSIEAFTAKLKELPPEQAKGAIEALANENPALLKEIVDKATSPQFKSVDKFVKTLGVKDQSRAQWYMTVLQDPKIDKQAKLDIIKRHRETKILTDEVLQQMQQLKVPQ